MCKEISIKEAELLLLNTRYDIITGVPDSLLKNVISKINTFSETIHVPSVNEAHAVAIAFGAMLAGKRAAVYLQNSGLGNIINPITSLCIPSRLTPDLFIGHRHTLEQHKIMGEIDKKILMLLKYENAYLVHGDNNVK